MGFKFDTVKDIFYNEFLRDISRDDKATLKKLTPSVSHLNKNFRTHSGVINIANSVVELIYNFFPGSIDKLDPESSCVFGPPPLFIDSADDLVVELFQNGDMGSCDFGAEQVVLVRDEATKAKVTSISGNRALVLTCEQAKGMEFTDCLVYNFFESSPLKNCWRVIYNAMNMREEESNYEARPTFDLSKHSGLCVELKLLYVLLTRARQHLVIFDEDVASRKPMLDYWCQQHLVQLKPLDENIRSMFLTVSTPEEWKQKGEEFFSRHQFRNAAMCYGRAGDDYHERISHASELEQDAEKVVIKRPEDAKSLYIQAGVIFEKLGGYLSSAARCYEEAKVFQKAAELYLEFDSFEKAAVCFERIPKWMEAADAHQRNDAVDRCITCCYNGKYFDLVLEHITKFKARHIISQEQASSAELLCVKKAAIHFHGLQEKAKMLHFVHLLPTTEDKRVFLKRYGHNDLLLKIELDDNCYKEAAEIYGSIYDFENASKYYFEASMIDQALQCSLKHIRLQHYNSLFEIEPVREKKYLKLIENIAEQSMKSESLSTTFDGELMRSGIQMLTFSPERQREPEKKKKSSKHRTQSSKAVVVKNNTSLLCNVETAVTHTAFPTVSSNGSDSAVWQGWTLHLQALRVLLRYCDSSPLKKELIADMDFTMKYVLGTLDKLSRNTSLNMLSSIDLQKVLLVLDFFELRLQSTSLLSNTVVGPCAVKGLSSIFEISGSGESSEFRISLKQFSLCAVFFFTKVFLMNLDFYGYELSEKFKACEVKSFFEVSQES